MIGTSQSPRALLMTLALILGQLTVRPSFAAGEDDRKEQFRKVLAEALQHFKAGEYEQAVEDFQAAYALDEQPVLVYNIARSYEKGLKRKEAIEYYERYIDLPGSTAKLRNRALEALVALKREESARAEVSAAEESASNETPSLTSVTTKPPTGKDRTLEWALIGSGAALLGTGVVFGVLALNSNSDFEAARDAPDRTADQDQAIQDLADEADRNALIADVLYGVGAAAAVTGIVLFLATGNNTNSNVALGPVNGPRSGTGIALSGRF